MRIAGVPQPPTDMVTGHTAQVLTTAGIGGVCVLLLAAAAVFWRRTGNPNALLMMAGGLVCSLGEPIVDILGMCYFPRHGSWVAFTTFGRPMPVWLVAAYVLYFGALAFIASELLRRSPTRRQVWTALGGLFAINLVLELPTLANDVYLYYGPQPFKVAGFPLAWLTINAEGALLGAVVLVRLGHLLTGRRRVAVLAIPFATYWSSWLIAMPQFMLVNSGVPDALRWVGSAATIGAGLLFIDQLIRIGTRAGATRAPAAIRSPDGIRQRTERVTA